jgi:hypothetical protein
MPRLTEYALDKSGKEVNFAIVIYLIKPEGMPWIKVGKK